VSRSAPPDKEPNSTSTLLEQPGVLVTKKYHFLVRWSHWLNVPILVGLILSGISIYWASPIYRHKPDPMGGGWRSLLPRRTDLSDIPKMVRYYIGVPFARLARHKWPHPPFSTKYNALQRASYFAVPIAACLSIATGWAIHKPMQFHGLAAFFGGYNAARVWHFWPIWFYIFLVVPHVILVFANGWDMLRGMIVGWSTKVERSEAVANEQ
jgi:cytochrome b subunit of formate dehydrogenase